MDNGYIFLQRKIQECWIWTDEPFSRGQAWIDILLLAEWKDRKKRIGNQLSTVKRGSFHLSIVFLADRWKWSRNRVMRFLAMLEADNMITTERTPYGTTVTIVKYDDYQTSRTPDETPNETAGETSDGTPDETPDGTHMNKYKKDKEDKEVKKDIRGRFTPPTLDEIKDYVFESGINIDAEAFFDHYTSNGWLISGRSKMKDWKAAVRNWERNDRKWGRQNNKPQATTQIDWSAI